MVPFAKTMARPRPTPHAKQRTMGRIQVDICFLTPCKSNAICFPLLIIVPSVFLAASRGIGSRLVLTLIRSITSPDDQYRFLRRRSEATRRKARGRSPHPFDGPHHRHWHAVRVGLRIFSFARLDR